MTVDKERTQLKVKITLDFGWPTVEVWAAPKAQLR